MFAWVREVQPFLRSTGNLIKLMTGQHDILCMSAFTTSVYMLHFSSTVHHKGETDDT